MSAFGQIRGWLRSVVLRNRLEQEMHDEMNAHIEQAAERYVARGMSEKDALYAARREFGNTAHIQEQSRDSRGGRWVEQTVSDMRYAIRHYARTPFTTITIILTMTLAVGGNAVLYSVLRDMFFDPPPGVPDDPSMVVIRGIDRSHRNPGIRWMSYGEMTEYGRLPEFESVAGFYSQPAIADFGNGSTDIEAIPITYVTPNYFSALGVSPVVGSTFLETRFDAYRKTDLTAVVSHALALKRFGTAESAVGRSVRLNEVVVTIAGVAPPQFWGASPFGNRLSFWLSVSAMPAVRGGTTALFASPDSTLFTAIGKLAPEVSVKEATQAARRVAALDAERQRRMADTDRERARIRTLSTDVVRLRGQWQDVALTADEVLGWTSILVFDVIILLVCATTVSSLLVGSAITRRHEIAVRLSLGASRSRIVRQLLTESTLLALAGGMLGLLLFVTALRVLSSQLVNGTISPDWSVALFTALFGVLVALLCGMSPAMHATRHGLSDVLKDSTTGATPRSRMQRTLVVAQIALAQPLLVSLAVFGVMVIGHLGHQTGADIEDNLIVARFDTWTYHVMTKRNPRLNGVVARLASTPGIRFITTYGDGFGTSDETLEPLLSKSVTVTQSERIRVEQLRVSPGYFEALDIPIVRGRGFNQGDTGWKNVSAIVSTKFAKEYLGNGETIGRQFYTARGRNSQSRQTLTIIGVVNAERVSSSASHIFIPLEIPSALLIRTTVAAESMTGTVRSIIKAEEPQLPIQSIQSMARINAESQNEMLQFSGLAAGGGIVTLLLGCVGLYAVVALAVGQRKREIGIRIALGAKPVQVVSLFFKSGLRLSLSGLAIGLPLTAAAIKVVTTQIPRAQVEVLWVSLSVAATVVVVASIATWLPARRAAAVDPVITLRSE